MKNYMKSTRMSGIGIISSTRKLHTEVTMILQLVIECNMMTEIHTKKVVVSCLLTRGCHKKRGQTLKNTGTDPKTK